MKDKGRITMKGKNAENAENAIRSIGNIVVEGKRCWERDTSAREFKYLSTGQRRDRFSKRDAKTIQQEVLIWGV